MDKIPLLVAGRSLITILNPNLSEEMFHCTPRALSTDQLLKSRFFTINALSNSGRDSMTFFELESHVVSLNPPRASSSRSFLARVTASSSSTNVASVGCVFNDTRKVKVLSLPETIKEKSTFRAKALRRE